MPSFHLALRSVSRGRGRSATAAAAYRAAARIACHREGRVHNYTRRRGLVAAFVLASPDAPAWATDREGLWNAAEAAERRKNSVVARDWELALPHELSDEARVAITLTFAEVLVRRFRVAADATVHRPRPKGDRRNHFAHVLITTRALGPEGFGRKTRELDVRWSARPELLHLRALLARLQNDALVAAEAERGVPLGRVDHRPLAARRAAALARGDRDEAELLDRPAERKLGWVACRIERRARREAAAEGRPYEPATRRGAFTREVREAREGLAEAQADVRAARGRGAVDPADPPRPDGDR